VRDKEKFDRKRRTLRALFYVIVENEMNNFWRNRKRKPGDTAFGGTDFDKFESTLDNLEPKDDCQASNKNTAEDEELALDQKSEKLKSIREEIIKEVRGEIKWEAFELLVIYGEAEKVVLHLKEQFNVDMTTPAVKQAAYRVRLLLKRAGLI
jgi:hypothetical protein